MKHFRLIDNLIGWLVFVVAAFTYCSTIEPTASFWDCPEFITTAYKFEVGHPPGAPFFMITGNLFTQFTDDPSKVAFCVNTMNALFSALCILFLFWSITHLARKLVGTDGRVATLGQLIAVEASGAVGALIYTFSDTFWFSAVEGEVYAYSSLFTALVFWLILKWEDHADEPHSDRWLILIAYLTGLSVGVHLLNLLCLPAIVLVFYYRKYPDANLKGSLVALLVSFFLIAVVLYGIVPGIVKVGGWFELLCVNGLGLGFNSGLYLYILLLAGAVIWGIRETVTQKNRNRMTLAYCLSAGLLGIPFYGYGVTSAVVGVALLCLLAWGLKRRRGKEWLVSARLMNTSLLMMLTIMIGYSSYAVIMIRSAANTPMDQNSPEDIFTLGSYLNREQYGDRPLFYGQSYTSQLSITKDGRYASKQGAPVYVRAEKQNADSPDRYVLLRHDNKYLYDQNMLFPRMYSDRHAKAYEEWMGGVKGKTYTYPQSDPYRPGQTVKMPTMTENLRFFVSYQVNFMYWRYFMWNFSGRQNDLQGFGEREKGNWITGVPFLDNLRLGDQSKLPTELRQNRGHNVYYALPLLLGLLGLFWQVYKKGKRENEGVQQFWVVFFLFFMTGLAIVVYLNQTPQQPRERDYAYAGSFYAFAIWCGLGVAALADLLKRATGKELPAAVVSCAAILIPVQMASQNWDDHDRSNRYSCRDFGFNYLETLQRKGNPIIYTNGDNDTFPLWYAQETEGHRTDARVCNLSYLQTDWYIDQMRRPAYDSPGIPILWDHSQYSTGKREAVMVDPSALPAVMDVLKEDPSTMHELLGDNPYELKNIIEKWILSDNEQMQIIPTDSIVVPVDKEAVLRSGMMIPEGDTIPDYMVLLLRDSNGSTRRTIYKSELMQYEMLLRTNWERPLYLAVSVGPSGEGALGQYFTLEGLAYRITPFKNKANNRRVDTEKMYDNVMNHFQWGNLSDPKVYIDETVMRMCYTHRRPLSQLALYLVAEGKLDKAAKLLAKAEEVLPGSRVPHTWQGGSLDLARAWGAAGQPQKGIDICNRVANNAIEWMEWYLSQTGSYGEGCAQECALKFMELNDATVTLHGIDAQKGETLGKRMMGLQQRMMAKYPQLANMRM